MGYFCTFKSLYLDRWSYIYYFYIIKYRSRNYIILECSRIGYYCCLGISQS
nr:MAG TPA: hypothetical protein [Bacteriophage sp.]